MQISPKEIVERKIVEVCEFSEVQQVGIDLTVSEEVVLGHGESFNVLFNEKIELPIDIFALIYQRSSYSRKGIFTTTGVYDPSYKGSLGCTLYNLSGGPIKIEKNTRVAQIVCFKADSASAYSGQYQGK